MITRRHFVASSLAMFSAPVAVPNAAAAATSAQWSTWDSQVTPAGFDPATSNPWGINPSYLPRIVETRQPLTPGDIHVDAIARFLYFIQDESTALRVGVAVGSGNLYEPGHFTIKVKKKWPSWTPTQEMIARDPATYAEFAGGMPGGPTNPLGSRALYLFKGGRDTFLRIHGTPYPRSIGARASSGCVRVVMAHINTFYDAVPLGATAHLYPAS